MRYTILVISFLILIGGRVPISFGYEETCVDVSFEILTGSGIQEYYSGDHFWYNVTMTNSGTTAINATFKVTVENPVGETIGEIRSYQRHLEVNATTILYPNYTRLGKDEVFIYFMDIAGTYAIELSSDVPITFYRYYVSGRYSVEHDICHINIDVMPSYQKVLNEKWDQYLQESDRYMDTVQTYVYQSRLDAERSTYMVLASILVATLAVIVNVVSIPEEIQRRQRWALVASRLLLFALIGYVLIIIAPSSLWVVITIVSMLIIAGIVMLYRFVIEPRLGREERQTWLDYIV